MKGEGGGGGGGGGAPALYNGQLTDKQASISFIFMFRMDKEINKTLT